jgi:hypothetical protein
MCNYVCRYKVNPNVLEDELGENSHPVFRSISVVAQANKAY